MGIRRSYRGLDARACRYQLLAEGAPSVTGDICMSGSTRCALLRRAGL